jgi:hypothetical protein
MADENAEEVTMVTTTPAKRPRGRPRKDGLPPGSTSARKRGRGRPRKTVAPLATAGTKPTAPGATNRGDEFVRGFAEGWLAASQAFTRALQAG